MSTPKGKEIIDSGWKSAGIFDVLELSSSKTSLIDPFQDKDLILSNDVEQSDGSHLLAIFDVAAKEFQALCGSKIQESDDDIDSEWEEAEDWVSLA